VRTVTFLGDVEKLHIHVRLGLLGDFEPSTEVQTVATSSLWVPGGTSTSEDNTNINTTTNTNTSTKTTNKSIDHKRVQYRAKETFRKATIQNRSVPPYVPTL